MDKEGHEDQASSLAYAVQRRRKKIDELNKKRFVIRRKQKIKVLTDDINRISEKFFRFYKQIPYEDCAREIDEQFYYNWTYLTSLPPVDISRLFPVDHDKLQPTYIRTGLLGEKNG